MIAGVLGMVTYIAVNGLGELFNTPEEDEDGELVEGSKGGPTELAKPPVRPGSSCSSTSRSSTRRSPSTV